MYWRFGGCFLACLEVNFRLQSHTSGDTLRASTYCWNSCIGASSSASAMRGAAAAGGTTTSTSTPAQTPELSLLLLQMLQMLQGVFLRLAPAPRHLQCAAPRPPAAPPAPPPHPIKNCTSSMGMRELLQRREVSTPSHMGASSSASAMHATVPASGTTTSTSTSTSTHAKECTLCYVECTL